MLILSDPHKVEENSLNLECKIEIVSHNITMYGESLHELVDKIEGFKEQDERVIIDSVSMGAAFADCLEARGSEVSFRNASNPPYF